MRPVDEIILHCSATRPAWMGNATLNDQVAEIRRWHVEDNGWADIGYHYLVGRTGKIASGRPLARIGAHTIGRNRGTIGICLIGGHGAAAYDPFLRHFTKEQDTATRKLVKELMRRFGAGGRLKLSGHNDYAAKACPGFFVQKWWGEA